MPPSPSVKDVLERPEEVVAFTAQPQDVNMQVDDPIEHDGEDEDTSVSDTFDSFHCGECSAKIKDTPSDFAAQLVELGWAALRSTLNLEEAGILRSIDVLKWRLERNALQLEETLSARDSMQQELATLEAAAQLRASQASASTAPSVAAPSRQRIPAPRPAARTSRRCAPATRPAPGPSRTLSQRIPTIPPTAGPSSAGLSPIQRVPSWDALKKAFLSSSDEEVERR